MTHPSFSIASLVREIGIAVAFSTSRVTGQLNLYPLRLPLESPGQLCSVSLAQMANRLNGSMRYGRDVEMHSKKDK